MKNKFIALALVTLSIATTTVSCTKEGLDPTDVKSQNVETTKVAFTVNAENTNATGKVVDRNSAPLFVENLLIWANSIYPASNTSQTFTFDSTVGLPTGFSLDNVALGGNKFGANSSPKESDKRCTLGAVILPSSSANVLDVMKAHTPYIPTFTETNPNLVPTIVIKKTGNDPVVLTMKTDHGRILAKFVQQATEADNYIATVTATVPDMDDMGVFTTKTLAETTITPTTGFEWSDNFAMDGQVANFTIKVYDRTPNGAKGQLLNTITKSVTVKKATTKLCTYTLKNTDVETNIENGGIVLTFPTILDEVIND